MSALEKSEQPTDRPSAFNELEVLRQFFDHTVAASAILDRDFNFIRVNPVYASADERSVDDFPGLNHFALYPSSEVQAIFQQVVDTGQPYQTLAKPFVYANNPERGVTYWDWTLVPVVDHTRRVELLLFSLSDVTQRKRAELELERFFELSLDLFCILKLENGEYIRLNSAFEQTLGFKKSGFITHQFIETICSEDQAKAAIHLARLRRGETSTLVTFRHICSDGSQKWLRWNCVPVLEEGLIYAVARDVTTEKTMHEEMIRLERLKMVGQMAACIGHEVRNPIAAVRASLQLLSKKAEFQAYKKHMDMMLNEIDRTHAIISRFLSLAKDKPIEQKAENLNSIIEDILPIIHAYANENGMYVVFEPGQIADVHADRSEICQLLLNLARNGLDAMVAGGTLTISSYMEGDNVVLLVQDQGEGISQDVLSKIGTPFFTTKANGTGLGMTICNSIMARHSGRLGISSTNAGTNISARFPQMASPVAE